MCQPYVESATTLSDNSHHQLLHLVFTEYRGHNITYTNRCHSSHLLFSFTNGFSEFPLKVLRPLNFFMMVGGIGGWGRIKMASANTQSANEPATTSFYTVQLKATIKAQISGTFLYVKMLSNKQLKLIWLQW